MTDKLKEFSKLLKSKSETKLQIFLEENTEFIPREFIQNHGIHFELVLRKLKIAEDYVTDFFYLSKSSDTWHCILIEIEKPTSKFFIDGTNDIHSDFRTGLDQITKWRAWFSENSKFEHFINNTVGIIRTPMPKNKCFIKYVLVTGRRAEYEDNPIRKALVTAQEKKDFQIITFDSLKEGIKVKHKLYLGVRKNDHIQVKNRNYNGYDALFDWMKPEQIRITAELKMQLLNKRTYLKGEFSKFFEKHKQDYFDRIQKIRTIG